MGKKGKFRRRQGRGNPHHHGSVSSSSPSSSYNKQASSSESDIPGYYYDEEKKNYFKILPNSMSSVGSFVTKETIKKKTDENRRLADRSKSMTEVGASVLNSPVSSKTRKDKPKQLVKPLLNVLHSVQCGQWTCQSLQRHMLRYRCLRLKPQPGWEAGQRVPWNGPVISTEGIQRLEVNTSCDKAVVVWSMKDFMKQWIKLLTLTTKKKQDISDVGSHLDLVINDEGYLGTPADKVTSMCWSPLSNKPGKSCMLYTTMCPIGISASRVSIFDLETYDTNEEACAFSFDLGRQSVWSCAWNKQQSRFSVGSERKCHVIDVHTRCKWSYHTQNSDSLAQLFSRSNPHVLYSGTRKGYVLLIDLRCPMNHDTAKLSQKSPVVCLRSLKDENYLMASDYSGLIRNWDLRFQRTVKTYNGLVNSHYQIPFYLDETEKFVYGTGSDGYCKIWDTADGLLLKSIAPPLPSQSTDPFPVSHLSQNWAGLGGNFGLVTAMSDNFFLYS